MTSNETSTPYLHGSIRHHLIRMTASGGLGLLALFAVDLADLFFISLLGEQELAAAVGFSGAVMFFTQAMSIGLSIAVGATVSRTLGRGNRILASRQITSSIILIVLAASSVTLVVWLLKDMILQSLGAQGRTLEMANLYLGIILPWFPFLAIGMAGGGVMRAKGDAKGALWVTLSGAIVNAILDPILIFGLGWGLSGAAIASVISRLTIFAYAVHKIVWVYKMIKLPSMQELRLDIIELNRIATPSILTNLATPIGIAYVTYMMAQYGDSAVAANAVISRLQMVAFVGLFALSSVVGTIAGQNWGAGAYDRIHKTLSESVRFIILYCLIVASALAALTTPILFAFQASPQAASLIKLFTYGLSLVYIFHGITFTTNALFNNLGAPKTSTAFNIIKATLFTVPFVWLGSKAAGAAGVLIGQAAGAVIVGFAGWYWCRRWIGILALEKLKN